MLQDSGDRALDRLFGIETSGWVGHDQLGFDPEDGTYYRPSNWINLVGVYRMLRQMDITSSNVFADFGCGKGVVVLLAGRFRFGRVIGIDLSKSMIDVARRNVARRTKPAKRGRYQLVQTDAVEYAIPADLDTCYFYMPFPTPIYEQVIANLAASAAAHPRVIRLLFLHPTQPDAEVPERHGFHEVSRIRGLVLYSNGPASTSS